MFATDLEHGGQDFWLTDEKAGGTGLSALARHIVTWASSVPRSPWAHFRDPSCKDGGSLKLCFHKELLSLFLGSIIRLH